MKLTILLFMLLNFDLVRADEVKTVDYVDLNKYLGAWYEIASFPQRFQKGCYCTKAVYSLRSNGKVDVVNSCKKNGPSGKLKVAKGYANVTDKKSNSKLRVTFFWPFFGDYWIIGLDSINYKWAVVSNPDRDTLWILSRTPVLEKNMLQQALATAVAQGLDLSKLEYGNIRDCDFR